MQCGWKGTESGKERERGAKGRQEILGTSDGNEGWRDARLSGTGERRDGRKMEGEGEKVKRGRSSNTS